MKILLVLSTRKIHRKRNASIYNALRKQVKALTWSAGTRIDSYKTLERTGTIYFETVNPKDFENSGFVECESGHFDIAIIDQSLDLTQDQSPSAFGGDGYANRSLDFEGRDRPSEIAQELTAQGTICIGTSHEGKCLDELAQFGGCVLTCKLEDLVQSLPGMLPEAHRLIAENQPGHKGLLGLTLSQPWAWSVFRTGKNVENRKWPAKVRGTIAIHVADTQPAGSYDASSAAIRAVLNGMGIRKAKIPTYEKLDKGAIIGLVDIVDCAREIDSVWFEGPIGFKLANPRLLPKPVTCQGKRRFFRLPKEVEAAIGKMI